MQAFLISLVTVAVAEIGDRTQLLTLMLAARYRKPWSILGGVLCASLANFALAGAVGVRVAHLLTPRLLDGIVGAGLIGMALWSLRNEVLTETATPTRQRSAFVATLVTFFVAELGDKTQIAALALAAGYANLAAVVIGATCGLMLANVPAVFIGHAVAQRLPLKMIHRVASALFLVLGAVFLWRALHELR